MILMKKKTRTPDKNSYPKQLPRWPRMTDLEHTHSLHTSSFHRLPHFADSGKERKEEKKRARTVHHAHDIVRVGDDEIVGDVDRHSAQRTKQSQCALVRDRSEKSEKRKRKKKEGRRKPRGNNEKRW